MDLSPEGVLYVSPGRSPVVEKDGVSSSPVGGVLKEGLFRSHLQCCIEKFGSFSPGLSPWADINRGLAPKKMEMEQQNPLLPAEKITPFSHRD